MQDYGKSAAAFDQLVKRARNDLRWSRIFLYIGAAIGLLLGLFGLLAAFASLGQAGSDTSGSFTVALLLLIGGTPFFAYELWANYWGWVTLWRWYWRGRTIYAGTIL